MHHCNYSPTLVMLLLVTRPCGSYLMFELIDCLLLVKTGQQHNTTTFQHVTYYLFIVPMVLVHYLLS